MVGEEVQEVVKEADAGLYLSSSFDIEFQAYPYVRLFCPPFGSPDPRHLCFVHFP